VLAPAEVPLHLLVFDDEEVVGRTVVRAARLAGLEAVAVSDAESFGERLIDGMPHTVVLDLQLGATDGIEQLRRLAAMNFGGALVLMSGFDARVLATARGLAHSLGLKVQEVMEKPLRLEQLEAMLQRLPRTTEHLTLERINGAIANDELVLDFQPIVTRAPAELRKLEALVRWEHPTLGRIAPGAFLPLAETDVGTIDALTDWVIRAVVDAQHVLAELGVRVPVALNMSVHNLHDLELPDRLAAYLKAGDVPARDLCVQISESVAVTDTARVMDVLTRLRLKGIDLSINDFGTGHGSLSLLHRMPFSEVKISRGFAHEAVTSRETRAIVKTIIDMAGSLGVGCAAEGVDDAEIASVLEQMGVRQMQGDLIARPMPVESVPAWLAGTLATLGDAAPRMPAALSEHAVTPNGTPPDTVKPDMTDMPDSSVRLPPRQLQVMQLLSEGYSVKEIARRLELGVGTVKVHASLAYSALGARNRIEAIRRAAPLLKAGA